MASSKVMPSTSSAPNSDLTHQLPFPIPPVLQSDQPANSTTTATSMDDFLKNMYSDSSTSHSPHISSSAFVHPAPAEEGGGEISTRGVVANGMDEVWKEPEMTLEDFLTRASGAVRAEEMRIPAVPSVTALPPPQPQPPPQCFAPTVISGGFGVVPGVAVPDGQFPSTLTVEGFGTGGTIAGGGGRAKRRAIEEPVVDKATQQRQRRMIKNRESAARSRERKQAYTVELESMVAQLEEENAHLQKEEAQETRERYKQLMVNLIPVTEKRRPPRPLRRAASSLSAFEKRGPGSNLPAKRLKPVKVRITDQKM
ncbi:hypothetical protein V2J09_015170 [Rumex salicifolius]